MKLSHDWWFSIQSIAGILLEDVPFRPLPSAVHCVSNRLLFCLIVGIYASGISIPLSLLMPLVFDIIIMVLVSRYGNFKPRLVTLPNLG